MSLMRFKRIALVLITAFALVFPMISAEAHRYPETCTVNGLGVDLSVDRTMAYDGEQLRYSVTVHNNASGACMITDLTVKVITPDGIEHPIVLTTTTLDPTAAVTSFTYAGDSVIPPYTITSTDGTVVGGYLIYEGKAVAQGVLHQNTVNSTATLEKTVNTTVINPNTSLSVTSSATTVYAGQSVTFTYVEENTGDAPLRSVTVTDDNCSPVTYFSGDTDVDNWLDPDESWTFSCTKNVNATEVHTANGDGIDETDTHINFANGYLDERASVTVTVIDPNTSITASADPAVVLTGGSVTFTYLEENTGDVELTDVAVTDDKCSPVNYVSGDTDLDNKLDTTETWTFSCTKTVTDTEIHTVNGTGKDPLGNWVNFANGYTAEQTKVTVTAKHPGFTVDKECLTEPVPAGSSANFRVTVTNTGDTPLSIVSAELNGGFPFALAVGATYTEEVSVAWTSGTTIENSVVVVGSASDLNWTDEQTDTAVCTVGGATRTIGYWQTHWNYAKHLFDEHDFTYDFGWYPSGTSLLIMDPEEEFWNFMGAFWAGIANNTDGTKRTAIDQARMIASQQAAGAFLNAALDNGSPLPVSESEIAAIIGGPDIAAIKALAATLDAYNNSGDSVAIIDLDGEELAKADPKGSKANADLAYWNTAAKSKK